MCQTMSQYSGVSLLCNACTQAMQAVFLHTQGLMPQVMLAGTQPPPSSTSRSCVYVVKRPDGMFYCGQSDNLTSAPLPGLRRHSLSFCSCFPADLSQYCTRISAEPAPLCVQDRAPVRESRPARAN